MAAKESTSECLRWSIFLTDLNMQLNGFHSKINGLKSLL